MGGKTATSTQQVQVPPQVLAQYQSVNQAAETTAQTPFQQYSGQFVAPVNAEQSAGIAGTNASANEAQPYYGAATGTLGSAQSSVNPVNQAATGLAAASAGAVNPTDLDSNAINKYLSPYLNDVVGSESAVLNQNNQQQQAGQLGDAIKSGAFGGDRTGIAAANLEEQQNISNASIYSGLLNTGYNTALSTAQQQQGVGLGAAQANRTAEGTAATTLAGVGQTAYGEGANTASELASLGTGAQTAGLAGAQAQIGAGTVQQQTQQAQDTAEYQQFLQQQSYPFQVDQFLANIAEGTGALSGSTTTTQQPGGFFSDERLKEDMEPIGKSFDGQTIYRYKMKGDSRDRIGFSAQDVEKKHPHAVGLAGGFRYVDYGKATEEAANRGHFYSGGVVPFRQAKAVGGAPYDDGQGGLGAVLNAQRSMYGSAGASGQRNIPAPAATHQLAVANGTPPPAASGSSSVNQAIGLGQKGYQGYKYFTKPPDTSGLGATASQESGAEAANINATMTPAPIEGLGAADTGAGAGAGDAAATGAGSAAAGAGADAAATGAATGAATAVAGEGAADAAAALAAEYAAADVAAVAIMAAKRGGKIVRKGYDTGGMPYTDPGAQIDIPDDQTAPHLQSAGPLVKQPTGLQTAMKLGDPNQTSSLAGSMFSNTAAARGGLMRARRADGGGLPDDFDDSDTSPSSDAGLGAAAPVAAAAAPAPAEPKEHLYDKLKKPENLIPILSAIGAMGTAKTRSFGTALAAGLAGGANSYVGTQQGLAKAEQTQAVTRGQDITNQMGALKVRAAKDYLSPVTAASPTTPTQAAAPDPNDVATAIDSQYRKKYFVQPWLPEEQAAMKKARGAAIALGTDEPVKQAQAVRDQRVQNQTAANQNTAQQEADSLYATATDPTADPQKRAAAEVRYNALHQWTGDQYVTKEGVRTIDRTGAPTIGVAKQQLPPSGNILTDANGNQFAYDQQSNRLIPVGMGGHGAAASAAPAASAGSGRGAGRGGAGGSTGFERQVPDRARVLEEVAAARDAGDVAPTSRNINQQLLQLSKETATGPLTATVQKLAAAAHLKSGANYQDINAYLERQAALSASAMGVPHTNAGLHASQAATGTTEYNPDALQEKVKFADALNSGAMAYRQGLDKAIGTDTNQHLGNYNKFRGAWAKNFDPDVYRADDAQRRGDKDELNALRARVGSAGMKALKEKSANLRMLENGQIPQ